jgi:hypothetical protein
MENGVIRREFLAGDGAFFDRTIPGDRLPVETGDSGGEHGSNRLFYFDLPLRPSRAVSRP